LVVDEVQIISLV